MQNLSLVICSYNRCDDLRIALESVAKQNIVKPEQFEVVVILNCCTDNSLEVTQTCLKECPFPYKIIEENTLGLSVARNRGVQESSFDHIAFIDDDVQLDEDWATGMLLSFEETGSDIIGGRVSLWFRDVEEPDWLDYYHTRLLGFNDHGQNRVEGIAHYIFGCNFAVNRKVFESVGGFGSAFGRVGNSRGAGEESELVEKAKAAGFSILYEPNAHLLHLVTEERLKLDYLSKCAYGAGNARAYMPSVNAVLNMEYIYSALDNLAKVSRLEAKAIHDTAGHKITTCRKAEAYGHIMGCLDQLFNGDCKSADQLIMHKLDAPLYRELMLDLSRVKAEKKRRAIPNENPVVHTLLKEVPIKRFIDDESMNINLKPLNIQAPYTIEFLIMPDPTTNRPFEPYGEHTPPMPLLCEPLAMYQLGADLMQVKLGPGGKSKYTFPLVAAWMHVAMTVDEENNASVFIGGKKSLSVELQETPSLSNVVLGCGYAQRYWDGWIKAVQIVGGVAYLDDFADKNECLAQERPLFYYDGQKVR